MGPSSCTSGGGTQTYTYDHVGNRTVLGSTGVTATNYAYDNANQLTSVTSTGQSATSYTYDNNGSVTHRGSDTFSWDAANRLQSVVLSNGNRYTQTYRFDDLRVGMQGPAGATELFGYAIVDPADQKEADALVFSRMKGFVEDNAAPLSLSRDAPAETASAGAGASVERVRGR